MKKIFILYQKNLIIFNLTLFFNFSNSEIKIMTIFSPYTVLFHNQLNPVSFTMNKKFLNLIKTITLTS